MKQYTSQSFWVSNKKGTIRTETIDSKLADNDVVVKAIYSGVSYGTEKIVFDSQVPRNQYNFMKAPHQVGEFSGSVKYGYLSVGKLLKVQKTY